MRTADMPSQLPLINQQGSGLFLFEPKDDLHVSLEACKVYLDGSSRGSLRCGEGQAF